MFQNCFSLVAAMAMIATPLRGALCRGAEKPAGGASYAAPAEVFADFQKGWKEKDGETVLGCVTEEYRGEILLSEWGREYSLRFPGPHILPIVSKHVDEKKRAELTRREIPTRRREFSSVLSRSLDDPRDTFLDLVKNLDEKSCSDYTAGEAADFTTSGKRGEALLKYKDDPTRHTCHFVKAEGGWLYAGSTRDGKRQEETSAKPVPSKPWTNGPAAKYASPQEVFAALLKAIKENDPETAWNCITDGGQNRVLAFSGSGTDAMEGDTFHVWYFDMHKWFAGMFKESPEGKSTEEMVEYAHQILADAIRDPKVLCSAVVKDLARRIEAMPEAERTLPELKEVVEEGDKAKGVLFLFRTSARGMNVGFRKTKGSWRLELPPFKELAEQ